MRSHARKFYVDRIHPQLDAGIGWEGELFRGWEMSCLLGGWLILQTLHLLHVNDITVNE